MVLAFKGIYLIVKPRDGFRKNVLFFVDDLNKRDVEVLVEVLPLLCR